MPAKAWPYAVTRGQLTGYQAVLVPGFLADAGLTYVLEYASRQETDEPDAVTVREVLGTAGTLSLAYRVREAYADRYGLGGEEVLEDIGGRPIRVFEGLVLRHPAPEVADLGLTAADLDAVSRLTVPSVRKLWNAEAPIAAEISTPVLLGSTDSGAWPLDIQVTEPYVVPASDAGHQPAVPPAAPRPPRIRTGDSQHHRPRISRIAIAAAIGVLVVIGVLLSKVLLQPSSQGTENHATAAATVNRLCTDLSHGKASQAYREMSPVYRNSTKPAAFAASLLGSSSSATCTSRMVSQAGDQADFVVQRANGGDETAHLTFQQESDQWQATTMSVTS